MRYLLNNSSIHHLRQQWRSWLLSLCVIFVVSLAVVQSDVFSPQDVPGPPEKVYVSPMSDSSMRVQFLPPVRTKAEGNNGAPVLGYKVDVAKRVNEVQTFTVEANGPVTVGSYKLTYANAKGTGVTSCLPWNATEVMFEMALEELLNVDGVSVTRSAYGAARFGYVYTIVFDGKFLVAGAQPNVLVATQVGCQATQPLNRVLTLTGARVVSGAQGYLPEVWEVVTQDTAGTNVLGGSFDLSVGFEGAWVAVPTLTCTVAAGSRVAVITGGSVVGKVNRGDMIKIGNDEFTVHMTAPFTDSQMPLDSYHIRGTTGPTTIYIRDNALGDVAVTQGSQTVTSVDSFGPSIGVNEHIKIGDWQFKVTAIAGNTISIAKISSTGPDNWPGASMSHITAYKRKKITLGANVEAFQMKAALNALPGVGVVDVSRVGPTLENGYRWLITFLSLGTQSNCPEAPCLFADKVTGPNALLTDVYGAACATCLVSASLIQDDSNNVLRGLAGEYLPSSIVATREISGSIDEVQTISTTSTATSPSPSNLRGTFTVSFRNAIATINFDDTAADVQTKLQNLATVGRVNVTRTDNTMYGYTWFVTFLSNRGDQPTFVIDATGLTGVGKAVVVQEIVKGVDTPFEAIVDGLTPNQDYYVRAFAKNVNGYGTGTETVLQQQGKGVLPLANRIARAPDSSNIIGAWPISGSQLGIRFTSPNANGAPISRYLMEYALGSTFGNVAIKKVFISNPIEFDTAGTFQLQYGDVKTPLLAIDATASQVEKALQLIPNLKPVSVTRNVYVATGDPTSRVTGFTSNTNRLATTPLTAKQCQLLVQGATILVGGNTFQVNTQPTPLATSIEVMPGHNVADFSAFLPIVKVDAGGNERGANGYEWSLTFRNEIRKVSHVGYPGLQLLSTLTSIESGSAITTLGISDVRVAVPPAHYGAIEVSANDVTCDTYVIGAPSADQVIQLFASTTITVGGFQLQLGTETTSCITIGTRSTRSNMQAMLQALPSVTKVSVEEQRWFKVLLLDGSTGTSKVITYDSGTSKITVGAALSAGQVALLGANTVIQVSRNGNDFTRHSCELVVATTPAAGDTQISVNVATGTTCADFTGESRSLRILDLHDYRIRFWGSYPMGTWPTLQVVPAAFGVAPCTVWSPAIPVYSKIHTVKYEGVCANGRRGTQTILADALSDIGGSFTLSYLGKETTSLSFQTTTAAAMRNAIDSITEVGAVNVTMSQYGAYGKAWRITFMAPQSDLSDTLFIKHSYLTGQDAVISVYPTVEVSSDAKQNDIQGTFRIAFGGQLTERVAYTATHAKVVQELQKLSNVDSVLALGDTPDMGVTSLQLKATAVVGNPVLTNVQLNNMLIDVSLYIAVREKLTIGGTVFWVQAVTPSDITLTVPFAGTAGASVSVTAGLMTKQTKPLPGFIGINALVRVITATTATKTFELPSDHGYVTTDIFFVNGQRLTVDTVTGAIVTTLEFYTGPTVVAATPELYVFDNQLRTTSDLSQLLTQGDNIWIRSSVTGEMVKYTVSAAVTDRSIPVTGTFTESLVRAKAHALSYGRKWTLVFRSYVGNLKTIDAIPHNDWRGTEARIGARHADEVAPQTMTVGNPAVRQTVLLEAVSAADVGPTATYTLTFGDDTIATPLAWTATSAQVKVALELLPSVDGVTVTTISSGNGFMHTIEFWGKYHPRTTASATSTGLMVMRLPTLKGTITAAATIANCAILIRDPGTVAETKRDLVILKDNDAFALRVFAGNDQGWSDVPSFYQAQTSSTSVIPTPPMSVVLGEYHGPTWLSVNYIAPVYTGGARITMYRLEWDSSPSFDSSSPDYGVANIQQRFEVQEILTVYRSDTNMGGTFTLAWGGRVTTPLPFDCSAAVMRDALSIITDTANIPVDPVKVVQSRVSWGYSWKVTFLHNPGDLAPLVADASLLTGDFPRIIVNELVQGFQDLVIGDFTHEVQEVYTDAKTTLSGTFKLEFLGKVTPSISVDATAWEMQDALQSLTTLYSFKVSRTMRTTLVNSAIWSVTFAYLRGEEMIGAGNIFQLTVDSSALMGTAATVRVANKIVGSDPFQYTIRGLRPGVQYYFHAMAYNSEGFGSATSPLSSAKTCGQPNAPASVVASVADGTSLDVAWTASAGPLSIGCPVTQYKVEWYRAQGVQEQHTITTSAGKGLPEIQSVTNFADSQSIGGFFRLSFGNERTENIAWNAPALGLGSVKERLERLATVGTVDVTRKPSTRVSSGLLITGAGTVTLTIDPSSTSTVSAAGLAVSDVIWILGNQYTIAGYDATTITVNTALTTTLAVPVFKTAYGFQWAITFLAGHVGPQPLLIATTSDSWAGNNPGIYVESVQKGLQPISGTFRVSFASGGLSHITLALAHNITADEMKDALENLITIGTVSVTRAVNGFGYNWLITFTTEFKNEISLLGVDATQLRGPSVKISTARTNVGVQPTFYCEKNGLVGVPAVITQPAPMTYRITGLTTGQPYAIRVRARNSEGYGAAAYITPTFQVPRTTPQAAVDVKLIVQSSRMLKVRWMPPVSDGGSRITSYKIQWDDNGAFTNVNTPNYDFKGELRVQPTDTAPFFFNMAITNPTIPYFVRVIAVNDQGDGVPSFSSPPSALPVDRTPGQPENVRATALSSYAILVEWEPSTAQMPYYGGDGGLPITQYMIEWDSSTVFDSPASFGLVDGSKRSLIVGGNDAVTGVRSNMLIPGTLYSIRITAFNAKGAGTPKPTTPPIVLAANQVPTVPRNLQLSVIPATSIKASWENPLYDGGASLKSYQVQWDEQDDFSSGQASSATIPIVREMQSVSVSTNVVNEEQLIDATVEVINEVQVVRTSFTGADEVQVIQTTNAAVVDEIQTVTTGATDRDEVQELRVDADYFTEIQAIRTTVAEVFEVQTLQVGVDRVNEKQKVSLTIFGAATDISKIGGTLYFSFDNTICTHCTKTAGYQRTVNLLSSLKDGDDTTSAATVEAALESLNNIDGVAVVRTQSVAVNGLDLTYVYTVTFNGDGVTGNVPELVVDSTITYTSGGVATNIAGIPTKFTEVTPGNEVTFDPASVFRVTHTCESYSDPLMITSFSTPCTPPDSTILCTTCVVSFDGTTFTLAAGNNFIGVVNSGDWLIAGTCVFKANVIAATTITVVAANVGTYCSTYTTISVAADRLTLWRGVQWSRDIALKEDISTISAASVVEGALKAIVDTVTVTRTQSITNTFVGSLYDITFRKRSGIIPLLSCSTAAMGVTSVTGLPVCQVTRKTIGSGITGSFTISLAKQANPATIITTPAIAWDATEKFMKTTLEAVVDAGEYVFGTVNVKRGVYAPTANKWSGGFTWQIEFVSRGWNIPKMTVTSSLANTDTVNGAAPVIVVEDADTPLNPFLGSRHGNMVAGSITFKFGSITSSPCVIGTNTDISSLTTTILDTTLAAFLVTELSIPTIQVTRSAATPARGFTWTITFSDPTTGGDVALLQLPLTQLTGTNARANMFETIKGNQLGGTFQLKFNGETTGPILFSADKLAVEAQLNALASIKPSSVSVDFTGPAISPQTQVLSYTWYITFRSSTWADPTSDHSGGITGNWKGQRAKWDEVWPETGYSKAWGRHVGPMAANLFMITCIKDGLTTTANDHSQSCTTAVQTPGVGPIKGTFRLSLDSTNVNLPMSVKANPTSTPIAHNVWATRAESGGTGTSMEEILESMSNIGDVAVSRSAVNVLTGGYSWTITFLRDANGPCQQQEIGPNGVGLCNAPGDVPALVAIPGGLSGATPLVTVCEKTAGDCGLTNVQNGLLLRGDFTTFKVTGDPGFGARYLLTVACVGGGAPPCNPIQFFNVDATSLALPAQLRIGDRFTWGTSYPTCIFTVKAIAPTQIEVNSYTCGGMTNANTPDSMNLLLPWNADENLVKRVLEGSSDKTNEKGIWAGGRKVVVTRSIQGKYGEVSWQIRFISNPTFTPPGAGNIPDILTVFAPSPTVTYQVTVTQVTPGSTGLSGSFLLDFASTLGPRQIAFDETEDRMQRKLNEMNTIGRVIVKKFLLPSALTGCSDSSCSGGWEDRPVDNPGTRGGYRWRVRFMKVTGEYNGLTYPSGSGNVGPLSVTIGTLSGSAKSIDVSTNVPGSPPILGSFVLNTATSATPMLQYSSSADSIKQGIESMNLFGEVDVTRDYLLTQQIPTAVATISKDGTTATITGISDIRQSLAPGDLVRFGPAAATNLVGTNGDSLLTSVAATSTVAVKALSPLVSAQTVATRTLFPGMKLRIDGLAYDVQRSGHEFQTIDVTLPTNVWTSTEASAYYKLVLKRAGVSQTTAACLTFNQDAATVETELLALVPGAAAGDIKVTRSGPLVNSGRKGYRYSIYFSGDVVAGNVAKLVPDFTGCTTVNSATVVVTEVTNGGKIGYQRLLLSTDSGQVVDSTGYFKLALNNRITNCLTWGISAADLETELQTTLAAGDVLVARTGSGNSLTEVQRLRMTSNSEVTSTNTGLFQLALTVDGVTSSTGCLAYDITAVDMQSAINQLSNILAVVQHVNVTREGDGTSTWGYGYEYLVNFRGPLSGGYSKVLGNMNQLEVINVGLSPCAPVVGGDPALIMETVREGQPGYAYEIYFLNYPTAYTPLISITHESTATCTGGLNGWKHSGGSVRKANIEMVTLGGSTEIQQLIVKDPQLAIPSGSSYKLTFAGQTTATCIKFDDLPGTVETILTALSTIGSGGVMVSRDEHPIQAPNGFIYLITFVGELVTGNVPMLIPVLNDNTCTAFTGVATTVTVTEPTLGGQAPNEFVLTQMYNGEKPGQHIAYTVSQLFTVMNEQFEVQKITVTNPLNDISALTGTYKLTVPVGGGILTADIKWDATEAELEALLTVTGVVAGDIVVTRRRDAITAPNGYVYYVYFSGASVSGNLALMTPSAKTNLNGGDVTVSLVTNGVDGVSPFTANGIPLALPTDATTSSAFKQLDATLSVFKVNGFLWTIKYKSTIGNIPALGSDSSALTGSLTVLDDFVPGAASNSFIIDSLMPGINYYVRAASATDVGVGAFTDTKSAIPSGIATPVQNAAAGYALNVREAQEIRLAATHITEVQQITTSAAKMAEVQTLRTYAAADSCFDGNCVKGSFAFRVPTVQTITITADGPISAGSFSIYFVRYEANPAVPGTKRIVGGGTNVDTVEIQWNARADDVRTAMAALDAVDASDIIVTRDGDGSSTFGYGYIFSITFVGNVVAGETSIITVKDHTSGCSSCDDFITMGTVPYYIKVDMNKEQAMGTDTAVQEVIVTADKPLFAGSYKLRLNYLGAIVDSACINFDAPARGSDVRAMENLLLAMSNIDRVYVTRSLDAVRAKNGFVYRIFFYGNLVQDIINVLQFTQMGCTPFQTQENNALTTNGVNGQVLISIVDKGRFDPDNTFVDPATATAAELNEDLNRLPVFGDVIVTRSLVDQQGGFVWTVAFTDSLGNLPQFVCAVDTTFANTAGTGCEAATLTDGNALSGSFVVESSVAIPFDASAVTMKNALEAMSWVGRVQVIRTGPTPQMGYTWAITFLDYFGDVPDLMVTSSLVGTGSGITVQEIRKGNSLGGTFTLKYLSSTTTPIAWNARATAVDSNGDGSSLQEKLEALAAVGSLQVTRSTMDQEGGYCWLVTFLDNTLNPGDVPLLRGDASTLTGVGAVVATREVVKGSNAVGDQLWISFDPPTSDNGSPITKYGIRWDTAATFLASPSEFAITEPEKLYQTQRIVTSAHSLAWSQIRAVPVAEVQVLTIASGAVAPNTFTLSFRGVATAPLTVGATVNVQAMLSALGSSVIGTVQVTPPSGVLNPNAVFQITFVDKPGDLPLLVSSVPATATVAEQTKGLTNYRKEVVVFICSAIAGTVKFQIGTAVGAPVQNIAFGATLAIASAQLHTLFNVEPGSIRVISAQALICAPLAAPPLPVTIIFDRVPGDINLQISSATPGEVVVSTTAGINGVYNDVVAKMSGTFQVGYKGEYTRSLNAESSANDVRYALEDLQSIQTVGVTRESSYQPLVGAVDVVKGQIYVTCSANEVCDFARAAYGLPGHQIRIEGTWYTVRADDSQSDGLHPTRLYLGDLNGREMGYLGETKTKVQVHESTKGYVWQVYMMSVDPIPPVVITPGTPPPPPPAPIPLTYLRAKIPRLYPRDATVSVIGSACKQCYYLPTQTTKKLTIGQEYFIEITAYNENGKGQIPTNGPIRATPRKVPDAPSNVDLVVVSGMELEVFFAPPSLASTNMNPNFNQDISSYIVQWDTNNNFKHGLMICANCAVSLVLDVLTITGSTMGLMIQGTKFTIGDQQCVLQVAQIVAGRIDVQHNNGCLNFNAQSYAMYYYTYPPAVISGLAIQGAPPFRYLIPNLVVGTQYYVRVAAVNSVPVQSIALGGVPPDNRKWSFPLSATTKNTVPDPPISVYLYPFSGTTLEVQIQEPTRDGQGGGGSLITHYNIDVDTVSTFDSPTKAAPVNVDVLSGDIPQLYPGGPRVYYIKNLQTGVRYFVQVKAKNTIGYSIAKLAPNPLAPTRNPDGPVNVKVSTVTTSPTPIDSATVTWQPPVANGGLPITSYFIEWWGADAIPEIQVLEIKYTTPPTSAFKLAFDGGFTGDLPYDVSAVNLRSALMNIVVGGVQRIQYVDVSRTTVNINQGFQWRIIFTGPLNTGNQPMIQFDFNSVNPGGTNVVGRVFEAQAGIAVPQSQFPGKREVQVLQTSHPTTAVGGYFRVSYKGSAWSNYLSATINAADLKLALEALPTIGKVTVNLQGPALNGFLWTITFESAVGNIPALTIDASKITPANAFVAVKDGDNAVDKSGVLCLPGDDSTCPGTWSTFKTGVATLATTGESAVNYRFYETIDASVLRFQITGLIAGKTYFVAVTAKNALGLGVRVKSTPTSIIPPVQVPAPPSNVAVNVNPGVATQLSVSWSSPPSDGGGEVRMYRIEYDPSPLFGNRGEQDIQCPTSPTYAVWTVQTYRQLGNAGTNIGSGFFNLVLTRATQALKTEPIPWNAVAMASEEIGDSAPANSKVFCTPCPGCADICQSNPAYPFARRELSGSLESKLEYLTTITNGVQVTRSGPAADDGYTWTITFLDKGDDFILAPDTPNSLTCANNVCNGGDYRVRTTKIKTGVNYPPCTGSQIIPAVGALNKGQLYFVRVYAFNRIGFSLPGNAPSPQKPMVVPGPPTGVTLQVLTVSDLRVLFSPPNDDGGDTVVQYSVEWATNNAFTGASSGPVVLLSGGAPYYRVISGLTKGTFYYVRVRAMNSQGYGQYQISSPTSLNPYTTPSAPTQVTMGVTSSTMITVQWNVPDDDGGDAVSGYIVQWDISAGFDSLGVDATIAKITDITQRSYTITLLTPGTVYYVRVFAMNSGGKGTPQTASPASLVPINTRPGKPHSLQAAPTSNSAEFLVTWQQPRVPAHGIPCSGTQLVPLSCPLVGALDMVYGGSSFESYLVQWADNIDFTGFNWMSVTTTSALINTALVTGPNMVINTGLNAATRYYVRVLTVNHEGQKSDFCSTANSVDGYLCPNNLVLLDNTIVVGTPVSVLTT